MKVELVIWSPKLLLQPSWFNPLDWTEIAIGLFDEIIEPARLVDALLEVSWQKNVCPRCNNTVNVTFASRPMMFVLGVIRTVVVFCEATISNDENDFGEVAGDWFQNSYIGT